MSAEDGANSMERKERKEPAPGVVEKAARAAAAIVVFGIPLAVGTATVIGYGAYHLYRRLFGGPRKDGGGH